MIDTTHRRNSPGIRPIRNGPARREGALTLELVLVLPMLLVMILAVVQFGQYLANVQELALAARAGGEEAAISANLPTTEGAPVPSAVVTAIDQQLLAAGIVHRMIVLEHNVGRHQVSLVTPPGADPPPKLASVPPGQYVRVLIIVPKSEVMPNLLKTLGLNLVMPDSTTLVSYVMKHEG